MSTNDKVSSRLKRVKLHSPFWVKGLDPNGTPYDDKVLAMFQADTLIPEQFQTTYKRRAHLSPEKKLMLAMLQDAVICFQEYVRAQDKRRHGLFQEAEEWILSQDLHYFFSFENVCASLGFEASYLRQGLLRWKAATLALGARVRAS